ncbi:MAG: hypothetical protein IKQ83_02850 [Lachnospiraceae bacterium]|nr:hypothetical protein [Lachnospiraceae bacterium]
MVEVLLSWIFIGITSYVIGSEVLRLLIKLLAHGETDIDIPVSHPQVLRCLTGLCTVNVMAEIISIFGGIGMWADYLTAFVCLLIVFLDREFFAKNMDIHAFTKKHPIKSVVYLCLVLLMSYGTSRGYMHFDTNLYHAQAIHWIEDYGVVPGLANIQSRFGYNSAEFALNAFYGFKWLLGRSLHTSAGFFALLSTFVAAGITGAFKEENNGKRIIPRISDFVRIGLIFYLGLIYSEMISPASDYYAQLMLFDLIIIWFDLFRIKNDEVMSTDISPVQGILCILLVYAVTIKLSLAPLVLLALIPGIKWIRNKNIKSILTCLISGLVISVPYFIRGHIISGWILYPATFIGFGSPDWQVPKGMAQYDAREIGMWGRGITRAEEWDSVTAFNWIPGYLNGLSFMEKAWLLATLISAVIIIVMATACILRKKDTDNSQFFALATVLCIGAVTWFLKAPLIRYGYVYIIMIPLMVIGFAFKDRKVYVPVFIVILAGLSLLKAKGLVGDIIRTAGMEYYVNQQDYIDGDAFAYKVGGIDFYVAEDAGQIGYYKFPSTVEERHDFGLRGEELSDGFYHIN